MPQDSFVDVGGLRLSVRTHDAAESGSGPPVFALHGLASTRLTWDGLAAELTRHGRRTIALDQRGHGRSVWPGDYRFAALRDDVLRVLDALRLEQVDLIGHSLGGHIATLVAMHAPDRVRRLVLEDTPPPPRPDTPPATGPGLVRFGALLLLTRIRQVDLRAAGPVVRQLRQADPQWWERLTTLDVPTLVVRGGPGSHVSAEQVAEVAATLPDADLVTIAEAAHRVHSEQPEKFAAAVVPFLTRPGVRNA